MITVGVVPLAEFEDVLTPEATAFVADLHDRFGSVRDELLAERAGRRAGAALDFLTETEEIRRDDWVVAPPREDYIDRRVEITGPTDAKMMINALNSGARGFMADCEDALSPTWSNVLQGQRNLRQAVMRELAYVSPVGRSYSLGDRVAQLIVRPRGWHLPERHVRVGGEPVSGALVDFGLYAFHCAREHVARSSAAYLYLPKIEHHLEARLWNNVFVYTQEALSIPRGSFRATVLIETLPAAFQMDEILWELRDHSYGLNAGRWDYIFSAIKCLGGRSDTVLPDRQDVTMTVPFLRAYTRRLVEACHRRGTFAMGGMSAVVPSRNHPEATQRAIAAVRDDKRREAGDGFDGTWVAHPDVVDVAAAEFDAVLGDRPNQIDRSHDTRQGGAAQLLDLGATPGAITEAGLRNNISVAFQYVSNWLSGRGAVAINNLMEDAATAEICRTQLWQWIRHGSLLADGRAVTAELVCDLLGEEMARIRAVVGPQVWEAGRPQDTYDVFVGVTLADDLPEFLTLATYEILEPPGGMVAA